MKYFLDTEFNEEVNPIEVISIGIVDEKDREFYAINHKYAEQDSPAWKTTHLWVQDNVKPIITLPDIQVNVIGDEDALKQAVREFTKRDSDPFAVQGYPEFWGYVADYDWFLLCRLFGSFEKAPSDWKPFCYDVKQYARHAGVKGLPTKFKPEHNALIDARWTKKAYEHVFTNASGRIHWPSNIP